MIQYCNNCKCMTNPKKGKRYICGKCGKDRRLKEQEQDENTRYA
jgi:ribosomal protein S27AE